MLYGQNVIVSEPTANDMWPKSFMGQYVGEEAGKAVVTADNGTVYLIDLKQIRSVKAIDYITIGIA